MSGTAASHLERDGVDVAIVGGGFAGLSAALLLGRARRTIRVHDGGPGRNAAAAHSHNLLTREGEHPAALLRRARLEVDRLATVQRIQLRVAEIADGDDGRLAVRSVSGAETRASAVLLAVGVRDRLPAVPGLAQLWGSRVHTCPYCDANAYTGGRLLVIGPADDRAYLAQVLRQWTEDVVALPETTVAELVAADERVIARTADGEPIQVDGVFVTPDPIPQLEPAAGLGLELWDDRVLVDGEQRSSHPAVWAAGDCSWGRGNRLPTGQIAQAIGTGNRAAIAINIALTGRSLRPPAGPES